MKPNQSFCYPCFAKSLPLDQVFAGAFRIGFRATEWWFRDETFEETLALAKRHGLDVVSICGHRSISEGLNDPLQHDRIESTSVP